MLNFKKKRTEGKEPSQVIALLKLLERWLTFVLLPFVTVPYQAIRHPRTTLRALGWMLSVLFILSAGLAVTYLLHKKEIECMEYAIDQEARNEGKYGWRLVSYNIMQRVRSRQFPNTVCGVVFQKVQYSFTNKLTADERRRRVTKPAHPKYGWLIRVHAIRAVLGGFLEAPPREWKSCLYYKRVDNKGTTARGRSTFRNKRLAGRVNAHGVYCTRGKKRIVKVKRRKPKSIVTRGRSTMSKRNTRKKRRLQRRSVSKRELLARKIPHPHKKRGRRNRKPLRRR